MNRRSNKSFPLKELCSEITVGYVGPMTKEYVHNGVPLLRSLNIKPYKLNLNDIKFISVEFHKKIRKSALSAGDVVIVRTGQPGASCVIPNDFCELNCSDLVIARPDITKINPHYLAYFFNSIAKRYVDNQLVGAIQQHFNIGSAKEMMIQLPSMAGQEAVVRILNALNHKIQLNHKINQELEAMAKTLYDYWFVQFDFPNEEGKPYKSSGGKMVYNEELKRAVPEGWDVKELGDMIDIQRGISYKSSEIVGEGISMINLNSFNLDGTFKSSGIKTYSGKYSEKHLTKSGELLIAATDVTRNADIIGKAILVPQSFKNDLVYSMDIAKVIPKKELSCSYLMMLFNSNHYHNYIKWFASGTIVLHLNMDGMRWYKAEIPPSHLIQKFDSFNQPLANRINQTQLQNQRLTELRDWLLPMLMNGQVIVSEGEEKFKIAAEPKSAY